MSDSEPQRLLTAPLVVFLLLVAGIVGGALAFRTETPDLEGAVELLADGDLDRAERDHMLLLIMELGESATGLRGRWAAALAAVAMADREAFDRLESRLGNGPERVLPVERQKWLSLGDPVLANLLAAMLAEAAGDRGVAVTKWRQVGAQSRLTANPVSARLAEEALLRLK